MERARLRERLEQLNAELERTESVDSEARRLLVELLDEIQQLLDRSGAEPDEPHGIGERLAEAARDFEESHPQLATTVGRVVDALANMGI